MRILSRPTAATLLLVVVALMTTRITVEPAQAASRMTTARNFVTAEPHKYWGAWVHCPAGTLATGGGGGNGSGDVRIVASRAIDGGTGWDLTIANFSDQPQVFSVYAICWSGLTNYQVRTETAVAINGALSSGYADCTNGGTALGGGIWADTNNIAIRYLAATQPRNAYFAQIYNADSALRTMTIQTICANGITADTNVASLYRDVAPGQRETQQATCPEGRSLISGGLRDSTLQLGIPDPQPGWERNWLIVVRNETAATQKFVATVLCGF